MKRLIFMLILAASAQAASLTMTVPLKWIVHPVASFQTSSKSIDGMLLTDSILQAINMGDYATTHRAFTGADAGKYCENNPLLVSAPCVLDLPRFTGIKIAVAAYGVAQWVPVWLHRAGPNYKFVITVLNAGSSVPLGIAVIGNIKALEH